MKRILLTLTILTICAGFLSAENFTKPEIVQACHEGVDAGATHLLIVWDTWNPDDTYPFIVYCYPSENVNEIIQEYSGCGFSRVSAVYKLDPNLTHDFPVWKPE